MNDEQKNFKISELVIIVVLLLLSVLVLEAALLTFLVQPTLDAFNIKALLIFIVVAFAIVSLTVNRFRKIRLDKGLAKWKRTLGVYLFFLILIPYTHLYLTDSFDSDSNSASDEYTIVVKNRESPIVYSPAIFDILDTSDSSFVKFAIYDEEEKYLVLGLNETNYQYCDVSQLVWNNFTKTKSFGTFYNQNIKGKYSCNEENEPVYTGELCLSKAIKAETNYLASMGYYGLEGNAEGPYVNSDGDFPSETIANDSEELMNSVYFECLNE